MKSDVITVTSDGSGMEQALSQAEAVAAFRSLPKKSALHLRLLTEEMMAMLREITGETAAKFWIEDEKGTFALHLTANTTINRTKREELLSVSTSGENAAAKGILGKLRDVFERSLDEGTISTVSDAVGALPAYYSRGVVMQTAMSGEDYMSDGAVWSMQQYRESVGADSDAQDTWDELEKSVVARLADEVSIGIRGDNVEMIIYKKC